MSYAIKNPTPEQIERRRQKWREYYHRHPEKHRERAREYKARRTPEQIEARQESMKSWRSANPEKVAGYRQQRKLEGYDKRWKAANPEKVALYMRRMVLKRKYGISLEDYDVLLEAQGGVCAICHRPERMKIAGRLMRLAVDHVRDSRHVRGLLCAACNRAIGNLDHNPAILQAAIDYLTR